MTFLQGIESWFTEYPFFGTLLILMAIDVCLGMIISIQHKRVSSDISRRGMTRKVVMLLLVLTADVLGRVTGVPGARKLASLAFMVPELISVLENAALLGVPTPPFLSAMLLQLRYVAGDTGKAFRLGDSPAEHETILAVRDSGKKPTPAEPLDATLAAIEKGELPL